MAKLTWLAGLAFGAVMLGGCGQTQNGDQEPSATAGGSVTGEDIFPSDVQGKWGDPYGDETIEGVCSDEDGKGIWVISSDQMSGYEAIIKGLNVSQEGSVQNGRQWQVQVSASAEGELTSGVMTLTFKDDGGLDVLFPEWSGESWQLQPCDA